MMLPIIQSKLQIPVVKDEYIRRLMLTKKLRKIPEYPLTIVHSGAGYGKSTALALFMRDEKVAGCWYSVSSMDDDILPFLAYLIQAIRKMVPHFGKELLAFIETMDKYIRDEEINLLCSLFINELLAAQTPIILIVDDFHQIEHSYRVNSWMEKLINHIPVNFHLVISSRSRPNWKDLSKMKVCGQLLEIVREDLVLTLEEMDLLLTDLFGVTVNPAQLQSIYQMTEGWIIALCMIAQQIPNDMESLPEYSSHSLQDLFQYLVMEVFLNQPPKIQQFLEQTSIFEEIDEEICSGVIGMNDVFHMLEQLKERNLFLQKVGKQQYRYHALFKDFLENQFQNNHPAQYIDLHEKCAQMFESKGMWEAALYHYKKVRNFKRIGAILINNGSRLIESGKLESIFDYLKFIPGEEMEKDDHLLYLMAEIYRYRSNYQVAEEYYQKAYMGAKQRQSPIGMSKALEGKAKIFLDTIQPYQAEGLLYEAITCREKGLESSGEGMGRLYQLLAENLLNLGKSAKAEKWLQKAKHLNDHNLDGNLEARLYLRTGRFTEAKKILSTGKQDLEIGKQTSLPQSHRDTNLLLSLIEAFSGKGDNAKMLAQAGIQQGIRLKAPMVEACGWIRMGHAVQLLNQYELDLAKKCYETALEIMEQLNISRGKAEPLMGLSILYGIRGDYERSMEAGNKALKETEKVCDLWLSGLITLSMGITSIYHDQFAKALRLLEKTDSLFQHCEDQYGQMLCKFWLSYLYYLEKAPEFFRAAANSFLNIVQIDEYEFFFTKRSLFGPRDLQVFVPLLIECIKADIQKNYAMKILMNMGITTFDTHPGYSIRVQTLGEFKIWLGEKEVGEKAWQREKAKELFQLLITKKTFISKDEITQILWPEQDRQSGDRDFKVALNALQHVLEPMRKARAAPFFVIREGTFYGLNPLAVIELDTVHFQEYIQSGLNETRTEAALELLEKGLALYHGEYLPDRRYDDWCISKRESMLVYFLRGAEKLAQLSVRNENYEQAIYWCEKMIERDRTWEEAYRLLMYCYYRKNNRPYAIKWYQKCYEVLEEELGVPPLDPTRHMYKMIMDAAEYMDQVEQP
jgi:DNA-binding SARP family transcriptional activator